MIKNTENEIDVNKIFSIIWNEKFLILLITSLISISGLYISFSIPNTYTSSALLAPSISDSSLSTKLGNYSSLAGLAGVNLPDENASKSDEAIARIKSYDFFYNYFLPNIALEDLFAIKRWDMKENEIIYDEKKYNPIKNEWTRKVSFPKKTTPSGQEAYKIYQKILKISQNKKTSFVTISIDSKSPYLAKDWLEIIIYKINSSMQSNDNNSAKKSINFLKDYSKSINIQSLQDAISSLLESQMHTLMLTSENEFYVYKIINSPTVPEEESSPNRILIFLLSVFFGFALSVTYVFINYAYSSSSKGD